MRQGCRAAILPGVLSLLLALAAGAAGCGGHHNVDDEPEADPNAPTPLTVTNNNWLDVVVYVYHDGEATRIATVTAATTANYFLAPWMLGHTRNIRLIGHAVGSNGNISTELIHIQPGQFIEWRLESDLSRSSVAVY
ncbi:MAG: hypothetical protein ACM34D_12725 [Gemmatimonadota bacterium]